MPAKFVTTCVARSRLRFREGIPSRFFLVLTTRFSREVWLDECDYCESREVPIRLDREVTPLNSSRSCQRDWNFHRDHYWCREFCINRNLYWCRGLYRWSRALLRCREVCFGVRLIVGNASPAFDMPIIGSRAMQMPPLFQVSRPCLMSLWLVLT